MTAAAPADQPVRAGSAGALSSKRPLGDRSFQLVALAAGLLVLVILVLIAVTTTDQATSWFTQRGHRDLLQDLGSRR